MNKKMPRSPKLPRSAKPNGMYKHDGADRLLPRLSLAVFDHYKLAALAWILLAVFGILSYTTFLKREGFPSIDMPYTVISGAYLVNDPAKVDREITKPIGDVALKDDRVKSVQSQARAAFFTVVVQYKDGTDAVQAAKDLQADVNNAVNLPKRAKVSFESPKMGFTARGDDAVLTLYQTSPVGTGIQTNDRMTNLTGKAKQLADDIKDKHIAEVKDASLINPFTSGVNPLTGKQVQAQTTFDRYAERRDDSNSFYQSVAVGVTQQKGTDVIKLDDKLRHVADEFNRQQAADGNGDIKAVVSASYATSIKQQIGELQRALLEGLVAVLIIGSLLIAVRASIITVMSMLTVLSITVGVLFVVGYTLNTITLFSLILCLGLIVDDTIIMVEALDAQRRRLRVARDVVRTATQRVSRAMVAATLTAALSFAPLAFVSGILGSFIRAIPVTVITSLLVSLAVALIFIPLFARYLLLGKKQVGSEIVREPAAKIEEKVANFIGRPMLWARGSTRRLSAVGGTAVLIGLAFVAVAGLLFKQVTFNIFPPSKDTNGLTVTLQFKPGTTVEQAEAIGDKADKVVAGALGENMQTASYYAIANERQAMLRVDLTPYDERDVRSPQLVDEVKEAFKSFDDATVEVRQLDIGPPPSSFTVRIDATDRAKALDLANDVAAYLREVTLTRQSGKTAGLQDVTVADSNNYSRADGKAYLAVTGNFDADDTSTLVALAQDSVKQRFDAVKLRSYGLGAQAISYDIGQEQDNQDSFKALALAFPLLLLVIYILLAVQFRSLLQPLLIFMAIPFSLFGITLGLYLSHNAFSFFAMLGFFALVGLSLKNTILLTDYANQLRRQEYSAVDAAVGALHERFRPLLATSLTAVVSLVPLAISSPFWEGLAIVLIGGLLSSTFLVVMVFPYYYLGAEFLRIKVGAPIGRAFRRR